ncbi:hypothetical protein D9M70_506930 [compost metagenome]
MSQDQFCVGDVGHADRDRPEALDLMFGWNRALFPRMRGLKSAVVVQPEALAFAVLEIKRQASVDFGDFADRYLQLVETTLPPAYALGAADPQARARNAVRAAALGPDRPIEEGQVGSGRGTAVSVEKVIGGGIVLIDGLLDQPQTKRLGIEAQVLRRVRGDRRQVMDPSQLQAHDCLQSVAFLLSTIWDVGSFPTVDQ